MSRLGLAASPTFVSMAWVSANDVQAGLCASAPGLLPVDGMAWMYLLMSIFHAAPWVSLASASWRRRARARSPVRHDAPCARPTTHAAPVPVGRD